MNLGQTPQNNPVKERSSTISCGFIPVRSRRERVKVSSTKAWGALAPRRRVWKSVMFRLTTPTLYSLV
jgi:hypothetical protein